MTRTEFEELVSFSDLLEFNWEESLGVMDDVISRDEMDEEIEEYIGGYNGSWEDLRDRLYNIETGYDYYRRDGYLEYTCLDEYTDFDYYKEELLEAADARGVWENGEDEEEAPTGEDAEELARRAGGYYFTDPLTGEILVAGYAYERISTSELNDLFM